MPLNDTFLIKLAGHITTDSPLACALPQDKPSNSQLPYPFPVSNGVPFYPATGILGALRRAGVRDIREGLTDDGVVPWSCEAYFLNMIGGANGFPKERKLVPGEDAFFREANPFESVFGSTRMSSRLGVGNAYRDTPLREKEALPVQGGVRTLDFERDRAEMAYLDPAEIDRLLARMESDKNNSASGKEARDKAKALKTQAAKEKASGNNDRFIALTQEAKAVQEAAKSQREGGKSAVNIRQVLPGYRYLPANTVLTHQMIATPVTRVEIGFFLAALRAFAAQPFLGGHRHHGCGLVRATWEIKGKPVRAATGLRSLGRVAVSLDEGFELEGDLPEEALALYDAERAARFATRDFANKEYLGDITRPEKPNEDEDGEAA